VPGQPADGVSLLARGARRFVAGEGQRVSQRLAQGSDKTWIKDDPQKPQSIWWLTNSDFVGFRVVRPVEEYPALKG